MKVKHFIAWSLKKYSVEKVTTSKIFSGEIDLLIHKRSSWGCFLLCLVFSYFSYPVLPGEWHPQLLMTCISLSKWPFFLTSEETLLIILLHDTFHEVANQDICNAKQWDVQERLMHTIEVFHLGFGSKFLKFFQYPSEWCIIKKNYHAPSCLLKENNIPN